MPAKQEQPNAYYGYSLTQMLPNELKYPKLPYAQRNYKMIHITNKSVEENFSNLGVKNTLVGLSREELLRIFSRCRNNYDCDARIFTPELNC